MALQPQQIRIKKISALAKEMYNKKGNKLTWQECISAASKKIK